MSRLYWCLAPLAALLAMTAADAAEVVLPPFYQAVAEIKPAGKLGEVVAQESVATSIPNAEAWRIAYVSSDVRGNNTLSTALVIAPKGTPPADGRPILAWAHGTTGIAQTCGPSQVIDPAQDLNQYFLVGGTSWTDFGIPAATHFIDKGYVLVATDYQGLGGGGAGHQYALSATQGRDVINSVRAVGSMGLAGQGKQAAVFGWSQGGGAALSAASLTDYIAQQGTAFDGVSFVGFVAMAPQDVAVLVPPDAMEDATASKLMTELAASFSDNVFNFSHFAMTLWAMTVAFPELKLTDIFTDEGAKLLDEVFTRKCMHAAADTLGFALGDGYKSLVKPQPDNAAAWVKGLIEGSVAQPAPVAPVIIYFGNKDVTVDPVMGKLYQAQKCKLGANITRVQLAGDNNHFTTPPAAQPLFVPWIEDLFSGKPLDKGCPE
jgi:pimeloyl-ACP methyl ester carboxylesterase